MKRTAALFALALALAACQKADGLDPLATRDNSAAIALLQKVNASAQTCWGKDRDFRAYRVIPELDTRTGKPRLLIVEAKAAQGLPKYVIEADGRPARIAAYGPLADGPLGPRLSADVARWASGSSSCAA